MKEILAELPQVAPIAPLPSGTPIGGEGDVPLYLICNRSYWRLRSFLADYKAQ